MKQVSVLVTHGALIAAIGNARHLFYTVNGFLTGAGKAPRFNVKLVGAQEKMELNDGLYTIHLDAQLHEIQRSDLIIIPPMGGEMESCIARNQAYIPWIREQYAQGAEVASLCVGAFLLAETGLLKGQECSSHWQMAAEFKKMFPDVRLVDDKVITDYKGLYTSGGSNSYWNLLVYLVEKYADRQTAIHTSKYFEVEMDRDSQSPFMIFEGYRLHEDKQIHQAQGFIEQHYQERISIEQLMELTHLSRRTFVRRFKKATHINVVEYLQKVKIEAAKKLLEEQRHTVNEVMFEVGYQDPKAFREVFKKVSGTTPLEYRQRFA